jgi:hypothetical protein
MTDLVPTRTLAELVDQPVANRTVLLGGTPAVVLGPVEPDRVAVYRNGVITEHLRSVSVIEVASVEHRLDVLTNTVADLDRWRRQAVRTAAADRAAHEQQLAEIRRYAIARHVDGMYCQDGLNEFLSHFELPEYEPRLVVSYTIHGSFEVAGTNEYYARRHGDELSVELPYGDDILDSTSTYTVEVEDVEARDHAA